MQEALVLFEQGNAARRLGRLREAAETYAELVAEYPRDRRAALLRPSSWGAFAWIP